MVKDNLNETERKDNASTMKKVLHYAGVLTAVCLLSGAGVSLLYVASAARIEQQRELVFENTLEEVIGDATGVMELVEDRLWIAKTDGDGVRYAAMGEARGYQSNIRVLVSADMHEGGVPVSADTGIYRLVVLSSAETPGLGENINLVGRTVSIWQALTGVRQEPGRPWFQAQFTDKTLETLSLRQDDGDVEAITGATETSRAVAAAAFSALSTIIEKTAELYGSR